ncbi:hypothetical protein [Xanthomonas arboricola]|uniref:hypothetical protein n=1 Tax=Xanthomonas arboricola TaxID=56448 RepID=UPI0016AD00A6|nr:hypothetical protein [Xanthomonas arboricola]NJB93667.1 outer membrane receptor protein involved in Fe transport [Xanthomonas arboricola]
MTDYRRCRPQLLSRAVLLALLSPLSALAQQAGVPQQRDAVTVTGSRIKRVPAEGPAPVQIIGAEEICSRLFSPVGREIAAEYVFDF